MSKILTALVVEGYRWDGDDSVTEDILDLIESHEALRTKVRELAGLVRRMTSLYLGHGFMYGQDGDEERDRIAKALEGVDV